MWLIAIKYLNQLTAQKNSEEMTDNNKALCIFTQIH